MSAGGRFGGHIVQGHVDGIATVLARTPGERWEVVRFSLPAELARYVVAKGSITVEGVSLTVNEVEKIVARDDMGSNGAKALAVPPNVTPMPLPTATVAARPRH